MPSPLDSITPEDLRVLQHTRANALLIGTAAETNTLVEALLPYFRPPVFRCHAARLTLPAASGGTLILSEVERLTESDQHDLHEWLLDNDGSTRVIATAAPKIFSLVRRKMFRDALYYRLNTVCLTLGAVDLPGSE